MFTVKEPIMKTAFIPLIGALTLSTALSAIAGPDWQIIEQARKAKLVRMQQADAAQDQTSGSSTAEQRTYMDKMMKECTEMMKR